jgi:colanic acid/amylovoran biosynthesis protein
MARDELSLKYLENLIGVNERVHLFPDFTNILEVEDIQGVNEERVLFIPNFKMTLIDIEKYIFLLNRLVKLIITKKLKPVFLIHEGDRDFKIAKSILNDIEEEVQIINPTNPLEVKRIIMGSKLLIVSRFHALVSALSTGVPVLSTSWSHKYQMLLKDYSQEKNLIDVTNFDILEVEKLVTELLKIDKENHKVQQSKFIEKEKSKTKEMWSKVMAEINLN